MVYIGDLVWSTWGLAVVCMGTGCGLHGDWLWSAWDWVWSTWGLAVVCMGTGCGLHWGLGVVYMGTGCGLHGDWLWSAWGLAVVCMGLGVVYMGTGCGLHGDCQVPFTFLHVIVVIVFVAYYYCCCCCCCKQNLPERCKVFRAMPNTPVILQNGVTIHASGSHVTEDDKQLLLDLLSAIGIAMEMKEHYMDIMTALSGGGPSFVSHHQRLYYGTQN